MPARQGHPAATPPSGGLRRRRRGRPDPRASARPPAPALGGAPRALAALLLASVLAAPPLAFAEETQAALWSCAEPNPTAALLDLSSAAAASAAFAAPGADAAAVSDDGADGGQGGAAGDDNDGSWPELPAVIALTCRTGCDRADNCAENLTGAIFNALAHAAAGDPADDDGVDGGDVNATNSKGAGDTALRGNIKKSSSAFGGRTADAGFGPLPAELLLQIEVSDLSVDPCAITAELAAEPALHPLITGLAIDTTFAPSDPAKTQAPTTGPNEGVFPSPSLTSQPTASSSAPSLATQDGGKGLMATSAPTEPDASAGAPLPSTPDGAVMDDVSSQPTRCAFDMNNLDTLVLRGSLISGNFEDLKEAARLRNLTVINTTLEAAFSLDQLPDTLLHLHLGHVQGLLGELSDLARLQDLRSLHLADLPLHGHIPVKIRALRDLQALHLDLEQLTGDLPSVLSKLTALKTLYIRAPSFDPQPIPNFLFDLVDLESLTLRGSNFEGHIPTNIALLDKLRHVDFSDNHIGGPIPRVLSVRPFISLNLTNNRIDGELWYPRWTEKPGPMFDMRGNQLEGLRLEHEAPTSNNRSDGDGELIDKDAGAGGTQREDVGDERGRNGGLLLGMQDFTCSCNLFKEVWGVAKYLHKMDALDGLDLRCVDGNGQMDIAASAGAPCRPTAVANSVAVDFDDVPQVTWLAATFGHTNPAGGNEPSLVQNYTNCNGCTVLKNEMDHFRGSLSLDAPLAVFLVGYQPLEGAPCCMVIPEGDSRFADRVSDGPGVRVSNLTFRYTVPVKGFGDRARLSITAARISPFSVSDPTKPALLVEPWPAVADIQRPSVYRLEYQGNDLMLRYPKLRDDTDIVRILRVRIAGTREIWSEKILPANETSFSVGILLKNLENENLIGKNFVVTVTHDDETLFIETITTFASPKLERCDAGTGVDTNVSKDASDESKAQCKECPPGTFNDGNYVVCHPCPTGRTTGGPGAVNKSACSFADVDYFNTCPSGGEGCPQIVRCDEQMNCTATKTDITSLTLRTGFWRPNFLSLEIYECQTAAFCGPSKENPLCATNHDGVLCNECKENYAYSLRQNECIACDMYVNSRYWTIFSLLLCAALLFLAAPTVVFCCVARSDCESGSGALASRCACASSPSLPLTTASKSGIEVPSTSLAQSTPRTLGSRGLVRFLQNCMCVKTLILFSFVQVYLVYARYFPVDDMPLASILRHGLIDFSCLFTDNLFTALITWTTILVGFLCVDAGVVALARATFTAEGYRVLNDHAWTLALFCLWLTYPWISSLSLSAFWCADVGELSILRADLSIVCSGTSYTALVVFASIVVAGVGLGLPLFVAGLVYNARDRLRRDNWKLPSQQPKSLRKVWLLHFAHTNETFWFEVYDLLRKFVQVAAVVLLVPAPSPIVGDSAEENEYNNVLRLYPQVIVSLFLALCALFLLQITQPYRNRFDSAFASLSMANLCAVSVAVIIFNSRSGAAEIIARADQDAAQSAERADNSAFRIAVWAILGEELFAWLALSVYDILHLTQFPDRVDEMRIKLKRNYYHRVGQPTVSNFHSREGDDPEVHTPPSVNLLIHADSDERSGLPGGSGSSNETNSEHEDNNSCVDEAVDHFTPPVSSMLLEVASAVQLGGHRASMSSPPHGATDSFGFATAGDITQVASLPVQTVNDDTTVLVNDMQFDTKGMNGAKGSVDLQSTIKFGVLGHGASGTVHAAINLHTFELIALKEVAVHDAGKVRQAVREVAAFQAVGNFGDESEAPCGEIVRLQNAFYDPESQMLCLAMEYVEGGSLQDIIDAHQYGLVADCRATPLKRRVHRVPTLLEWPVAAENPGVPLGARAPKKPEVRVAICNEGLLARLARDMLRALATLHEREYVHLDIKPANVLIDRHGRAKLADFGLAQHLADYLQQPRSKFVGTLRYLSPERLRGDPASLASDVWSLGLTLLTFVHGRYPLELDGEPNENRDMYWVLLDLLDSNRGKAEKNVLNLPEFVATTSSVAPVARFSPEMRSFLASALHLDQAARGTATGLLQHPWIVRNAAVTSQPGPAVVTTRRFDESCIALDRICQRIIQSKRGEDGVGPLANSGDVTPTGQVELVISETQVATLSHNLSIAQEIIKYSFVVTGDAAGVRILFA